MSTRLAFMASGAKYSIQEQLVMAFFGYWAFLSITSEKDLIESQRLLKLEKHKKISAVEMGYVI